VGDGARVTIPHAVGWTGRVWQLKDYQINKITSHFKKTMIV